jgi:hypothetical protein
MSYSMRTSGNWTCPWSSHGSSCSRAHSWISSGSVQVGCSLDPRRVRRPLRPEPAAATGRRTRFQSSADRSSPRSVAMLHPQLVHLASDSSQNSSKSFWLRSFSWSAFRTLTSTSPRLMVRLLSQVPFSGAEACEPSSAGHDEPSAAHPHFDSPENRYGSRLAKTPGGIGAQPR